MPTPPGAEGCAGVRDTGVAEGLIGSSGPVLGSSSRRNEQRLSPLVYVARMPHTAGINGRRVARRVPARPPGVGPASCAQTGRPRPRRQRYGAPRWSNRGQRCLSARAVLRRRRLRARPRTGRGIQRGVNSGPIRCPDRHRRLVRMGASRSSRYTPCRSGRTARQCRRRPALPPPTPPDGCEEPTATGPQPSRS